MFYYFRYAGINYVTVANNHLVDHHDKGIRSTMRLLKKYDIDYTGVKSLKVSSQKYKKTTSYFIDLQVLYSFYASS